MRVWTKKPVWTWKCDHCGREAHLAISQLSLPSPDEMRNAGWYIALKFGDMCPECASMGAWRDRQGDVWTEGADGLMHTPETRPFPRDYVERKWGPLVPVTSEAVQP